MKRRLSASIDDELLTAAEQAVAQGRAPSVSALVEEALAERMAQERRLDAARELFEWIEDEWGPISDEERLAARAELDAKTIWVRPAPDGEGSGARSADSKRAA